MIIAACLCWYDEQPAMLDRAVASLAGIADHLVALDGRWHGFPGGEVGSAFEQHHAIREAARAVGIDASVNCAIELWPDQISKRTASFALAPTGTDWLLVIDADEHVFRHDRKALEQLLDSTACDVGEISLTNFASRWPLDQMRANTYTVRRLFRAAAEPRYERAHNGVRAADGTWLSGERAHVDLADAFDASAVLQFGHSVDARPQDRHQARSVYYRLRADQRLENWAAA